MLQGQIEPNLTGNIYGMTTNMKIEIRISDLLISNMKSSETANLRTDICCAAFLGDDLCWLNLVLLIVSV